MSEASFPFKQVLVTGAAGFIGSNFVKSLIKITDKTHIISFDKLTYAGSLENLSGLPSSRHHFIQGDIADRTLLNQIFTQFNIDLVVNFAAETHVDNSISNPEVFVKTNILGTFTLLDTAHEYWIRHPSDHLRRFHHISTDEVYGELDSHSEPFTEKAPYQPRSPYSASKASSDHLVKSYFHTYGMPITISNCSNNFGPHQHPEKLIPKVIECCYFTKNIPVYGTGENIRDWLFVMDHCEALIKILNAGFIGETYNIGGNNELTNHEIIKLICEIADIKIPKHSPHHHLISFITDRKGHDFRYAVNTKKIFQELDWQPKNNFKQHLDETFDFYMQLYSQKREG